jgi:hypothetical protein
MSGGWEGERAGTDSAYEGPSQVTTSSERQPYAYLRWNKALAAQPSRSDSATATMP